MSEEEFDSVKTKLQTYLVAYAASHGSKLTVQELHEQIDTYLLHSRVQKLTYKQYWMQRVGRREMSMLAKFAISLHDSCHSEADVERHYKSLSRTMNQAEVSTEI